MKFYHKFKTNVHKMSKRTPSLLLVGNYPNRTGYAWNNIYRLFNVITIEMDKLGVPVCLSFSEIVSPIDFIEPDLLCEPFKFDINNITTSSLYNLVKSIKQRNIKYVYFTDQPAFYWLYMFLRCIGVRKILTHSRVSVANPYPPPPEKGLRRAAKSFISRIQLWTPNRIYAVSNFVRNRLINNNCMPEDKVVVIMNGINLDNFKCDNSSNKRKTISVFTGARANKYKGILTLIHAADLLINFHHVKNFRIEYAGDGPDIEFFRTTVKELSLENHFIFLGHLGSTKDAICNSDIVVVPSNWGDACPSSVSEGLASGKPLITTTAGGIPEMVGNGQNAILIPPSDAEALATELKKLIASPEERESLGARGRARAIDALDERKYYRSMIMQLTQDLELR